MCFKATCFAFLCRRTALHSNKYKSVSSLPREIMLLFREVGKGMVENQLLLLLNVHPWQISMEVSIKKVHIILSCVHITYSLWMVGWDFMDGIQARRVDGWIVVRMHLKVAPLFLQTAHWNHPTGNLYPGACSPGLSRYMHKEFLWRKTLCVCNASYGLLRLSTA